MVAITVILAAVIGTFVLGLGDSLGDSQPTASIGVSTSADNITLEHEGGDRIESGDLRVIVTNASDNTELLNQQNEFNSSFTVGDTENIAISSGSETEVRIRIIHNPSDSILFDRTLTVQGDAFSLSS